MAENRKHTPDDIMAHYNIKKNGYYLRLNRADIKAKRDESGKAYLDDEQLAKFDRVHREVEAEKNQDSAEIVKKKSDELLPETYQPTEEKISKSFDKNASNTNLTKKFDRAAQTRAASILVEAANRLTADYIANPDSLDDDLKEQVFFEESPELINREWAGIHLYEAMKRQKEIT